MSIFKKISIGCSVVIGSYVLGLLFLPHQAPRVSVILNHLSHTVLFFVTLYLFLKEPSKTNKFIFFNFFLTFSISVINIVAEFVGFSFLSAYPYANFLFWQYSTIAFFFFLALAITYLVIDSLFHELKTYLKYASVSIILTLFFGVYFHTIINDPLTVYKTEQIKQWKTLNEFVESSEEASEKQANGDRGSLAVLLSNNVKLQSWENGVPIGDLYPDQNYSKIQELIPYLEGDNYQILIVKPIFIELVKINVLLVVLIIVFFGYQYAKDPPQGAYVDKIMFAFLLFSSMEILHNLAFIKSLEWSTWSDLFNFGQYVTISIEAVMVLFFSLRLRFISSVQGEYYETEIAVRPQQITRWRDWVDNMILAHFFNWKIFNGRMFQDTSAK